MTDFEMPKIPESAWADITETMDRKTREAEALIGTQPIQYRPIEDRPTTGPLADVDDEVLRYALETAEEAWDMERRIDWEDMFDGLALRVGWEPDCGDWDGPQVKALRRWVGAQKGEG